ncbi:MAG: chromate resistance protein ChrB domain-containing protein, partial [Methylobacter sp.]
DRLACAWLIRRFIDAQAQILWLASPNDCPASALGFDFDGAIFSHICQWPTELSQFWPLNLSHFSRVRISY